VQGKQGGVPSTKEVQGKPPGEEQSKYQEHLIKLKQEHHQHHNQLPIEASKGSRYTLEIAYHEPNHGKNQDSCINKTNNKIKTHTTKPFYQVRYLGGFGVYLLSIIEKCSV
jgi:hypothetical protein